MQLRGFKTDRNVTAQVSRNPGFSRRLKQLLGLEKPTPVPAGQQNAEMAAETLEANLKSEHTCNWYGHLLLIDHSKKTRSIVNFKSQLP